MMSQPHTGATAESPRIAVKVAGSLDDMMKCFNVRAIVFIGEQGSLAKIRADHSVVFIRDWPNAEKRLAGSAVVMTQLTRLVDKAA